MKTIIVGFSLLSSVAFATNVSACGDKMVQVGRGVRYQRAQAVRSASIVMFLGPEINRESARKLRSELALVGHKVQMVDDAAALASSLSGKKVDIVLTDPRNLDTVTGQLGAAASTTSIVPVLDRPADDRSAELKSRFPVVLFLSSRAFDQVGLIGRFVK